MLKTDVFVLLTVNWTQYCINLYIVCLFTQIQATIIITVFYHKNLHEKPKLTV